MADQIDAVKTGSESKSPKKMEEKPSSEMNSQSGKSSEGMTTGRKVMIGCLVAVVVALFVGCGLLAYFFYWAGSGPAGGVLYGYQLEEYTVEYNEENDILQDGEEVVAYYDYTISLDGTESAYLTDQRVIYQLDGEVTSIDLDEVTDISYTEDEWLGFTINIEGEDGQYLVVEIAALNNGQLFVDALFDNWDGADTVIE